MNSKYYHTEREREIEREEKKGFIILFFFFFLVPKVFSIPSRVKKDFSRKILVQYGRGEGERYGYVEKGWGAGREVRENDGMKFSNTTK